MKKRIATIIFTVISFVIISSYSVYAENVVFINDNFENLSTSNWIDNTGRGTKTVEQNKDGKYMVLNSTSSYFNYQANNIYSTRRLYCSADIKFDSGDSEIQVRESRDVSASGFTMAGRLRKRLGYLEYFTNGKYEKMNDSNGNWIKLSDVSKWYTIRMVLDIKTNKYSIYVIDRQAQSVLTKVENVDFYGECQYINYFAFSSSSKLCVDNVRIEEVEVKKIGVEGEVYPKITNTNSTYLYKVKAVDDNNTEFIVDDVKWSISKNKTGISIDEKTGLLTVAPNAKPGPVLIKAENLKYSTKSFFFLIDIER